MTAESAHTLTLTTPSGARRRVLRHGCLLVLYTGLGEGEGEGAAGAGAAGAGTGGVVGAGQGQGLLAVIKGRELLPYTKQPDGGPK